MHDTVRAGLTIETVVPLEHRGDQLPGLNVTRQRLKRGKKSVPPEKKSARKCYAYEKRVRPALRWYALPPNGYSGPGYSIVLHVSSITAKNTLFRQYTVV